MLCQWNFQSLLLTRFAAHKAPPLNIGILELSPLCGTDLHNPRPAVHTIPYLELSIFSL